MIKHTNIINNSSPKTFSNYKKRIYKAIGLLIFSIVFLTHTINSVSVSTDSRFFIHTSMSIIKQVNTDLDEYDGLFRDNEYSIQTVNNHKYNFFPIGTSLMITPLFFLIDQTLSNLSDSIFDQSISNNIPVPNKTENFIASFITALSAWIFFSIGLKLTNNNISKSLLTVFIFAFCTSVWSTASQVLWQHGPSILMLTITLYIIISAKKNEKIIQFTALPLTFSYVIRPTNSIIIILISLYIFFNYRKYFLQYLLWASAIAIPFIIYNLSIYNSILPTYYSPSRLLTNTHFFKTLASYLISPSRGLFIFSPIFLFIFYGVYKKIKQGTFYNVDYYLLSIPILLLIIISSFSDWWAGHAIGPRFLSDITPILVYFIIPVISDINLKNIINKKLITFLFVIFLFISFFAHYRSATNYKVWEWNTEPINVDLYHNRVWDWCDIQFLHGINYCDKLKNI